MHRLFRVFLILVTCWTGWGMGYGQVAGGGSIQRPCLADRLAAQLRQQYPTGVPGRKTPGAFKTEADTFTYVIPVVVHVMYDVGPLGPGDEYYVTLAQIQSQIDVLNEGFGRYGEGANNHRLGGDVKFKFCLASKDPDGNPHPGYDYTMTGYAKSLNPLTQDTLMKKLNQWDPNRYVNIWTVRNITDGTTTYDGYTYIPEQVAGSAYDGIVVRHHTLGRDAGTAQTRGKTIVHEMGHYFDLHHPWGDVEASQEEGCTGADTDYCDDTPAVPWIEYMPYPFCADTNNHPEACNGWHRQSQNYMDYADDECQNLFTTCQRTRMRTAMHRWRAEMVSSSNLNSTGCGDEMLAIPAQGQIFVYPNPANHYMMVNLDIDDIGPARFELWDFAGRRVWVREEAAAGRGPVAVDLTEFAVGTYYLKVITSTVSLGTKVFVGRFEEL
jgi:hypothetical protein